MEPADRGGEGGAFALDQSNVVRYLVSRGILQEGDEASVLELAGGVSATVLAVQAPGTAVVVKQALLRLKVAAEWIAKQERTDLEARALRLCERLTPGRVPQLLTSDPAAHILVIEFLPDDARNWQGEIGLGRVHAGVGAWAGETLGIWHRSTEADPVVAAEFDDFEAFEQQRLSPFYEVAALNLQDLAGVITERREELRLRRCFVDGDYAMKNMLVAPARNWKLDFEVAHYGNPVFDVAFFLSFVVLSAVRWPGLVPELRALADGFHEAYHDVVGADFAGDSESVTSHTACLMLARTDGKSPAQFFDPTSRARARDAGTALLRRPDRGLWQWL